MLKRLKFLILPIALISQPLFCSAYNDQTTHPALTQEIISYYETLPGAQQFTADEKSAILLGSRLEDIAPRWINHFYDPIHNTGWTGDHAGDLSPEEAVAVAKAGIGVPDPIASPVWAKDYRTQLSYKWYGGDHTFESGMQSWIKDDKMAAYQTLGNLLHLLEDLAVPEHTRNDTHSGQMGDPASPYEKYAQRWSPDTLPSLHIAQDLAAEGAVLPKCTSVEDCFRPLALYTSTHYFSKDTINDPKFDFPKIAQSDDSYGYGVDENGKYPLANRICGIIGDQKTCTETFVLDDASDEVFFTYFSRLSKKAVLQGAAFMKYYLNEAASRYEVRDIGPLYTIDWNFITAPSFSLVGVAQQAFNGVSSAYAATQDFIASAVSDIKANMLYAWQAGMTAVGNTWDYFNFAKDTNQQGDVLALATSSESSSTIVLGEVAGQSIRRPPYLVRPSTLATGEEASDTQQIVQFRVSRVIDGDTIVLEDGRHVRYVGIDAPEMSRDGDPADCWAEESRQKNAQLVEGMYVTMEKASQDLDEYGRLVRYVYVEGALVNEILVAEGFARAYDFGFDHPLETRFKEAQTRAKELGLGMWSEECSKKKLSVASSSLPLRISTSTLRINEVATTKGEFVELLNTGKEKLSLTGYYLSYYSPSRTLWTNPYRSFALPQQAVVEAGGRYIIGFGDFAGADFSAYASSALGNAAGAVSLFDGDPTAGGAYVDGVGWGSASLYEKRQAVLPPYSGSIARREGSLEYDTNDNATDFVATYKTTPGEKNTLLVSAPSSGTGTGAPLGLMPDVYINEVMYDPQGTDTGHEWIEIVNRGSAAADVSKMKLFESSSSHSIVPANTTALLPAGSFAILCSATSSCIPDLAALGYTAGVYKSSFSLANAGETADLKWGDSIMSSVAWTSSSGANGNGKSFQKFENGWRASAPTPGRENEFVESVNTAPVARFSFTAGYAGAATSFNASSSTDAQGDISAWEWDFGDSATSSGAVVSHSYSSAGQYQVALTVWDGDGATSTATSSVAIPFAPEDATGARADHVVISEIQVAGADAGDEFIELYNPSSSSVDMSGWSLQYASAGGNSFTKKNFPAGASIAPQGFYLVARGLSSQGNDGYTGSKAADMLERSFSLSGAAAGGRIFLVSNQVPLSLPSLSGIVDSLNYSFSVPPAGKSLERKAFKTVGCVLPLPGSEGEFMGNACVHPLEKDDYVIRDIPSPQNSSSLPEPRERPQKPQGQGGAPLAAYVSSTMGIVFSWMPYSASTTLVKITETSGSSTTVVFESGATSTYVKSVREVGRPYSFIAKATDADGFASEDAIVDIPVPSFLSRIDIAKAPGSSTTTLDIFYPSYPFIPDVYSRDYVPHSWQAMVFYLNREANPNNLMLIDPDHYEAPDGTGVVPTKSNGYSSQLFALQGKYAPGYGPSLYSASFLLPEEDGHYRITLPSSVTINDGDYLTVAYYDYANAFSSDKPLGLVATDATHFTLSPNGPTRKAPATPVLHPTEFDEFTSKIVSSWDPSQDPDTPDDNVGYEFGYTTTTDQSLMVWGGTYEGNRYVLDVSYPNSYLIGARAFDPDGSYSAVATTTWDFPAGYVPVTEGPFTDAISQEFIAPASADIGSIDIYSPRFYRINGWIYSACNVGLYSIGDTGSPVLLAWADTPNPADDISPAYAQRGASCAGTPVTFTYADTHPHIEQGGRYMWYFKVDERRGHTQTFAMTAADKAGGPVYVDRSSGDPPAVRSPGETFKNAVYTLKASDGSVIYSWK